MPALEVLDIIECRYKARNLIGYCHWRSKIPHFRLDKIPQLTILGKIPRIVKYAENGEMVMLRDLYQQGLNISEIARQTGHDRKTVFTNANPLLQPLLNKTLPVNDTVISFILPFCAIRTAFISASLVMNREIVLSESFVLFDISVIVVG